MKEVLAKVDSLTRTAKGAHDGGSGGGDDMIEARIKHLETDVAEVKADLKNVRERLARIEGEIARLPGYPGIAAVVGLIVALSTAAQIAAKLLP